MRQLAQPGLSAETAKLAGPSRMWSPAALAQRALPTILCVTVAALAIWALWPARAAAQTSPGAAISLPPQGLYEDCKPGVVPNTCVQRLQRMAAAGFRVVLDTSMLMQSTQSEILSYVQAAQDAGVKLIWALNWFTVRNPDGTDVVDSYPKLMPSCGCSTNQGLADYIIGLARNQSSTWGYYLSDEPSVGQFSELQAYLANVRALDPNHPDLIVTCGCAPGAGPVEPFEDLSVVLGEDMYPVKSQAPDPSAAYDYVAPGMQGLQSVADASGRPSAVVLQAFSFGDSQLDNRACGSSPSNCRFPTEPEMKMQRDAALLNGQPSLILWFTLVDVLGYDASQQSPNWTVLPNPQQRWNDLVQAAFGATATAPAGQAAGARIHPAAGSPAQRLATKLAHVARPGRGGPRARFKLHFKRPLRPGAKIVADAHGSFERHGRIVAYRWRFNGRHAGCQRRACTFRAGHSGRERIRLTVTDRHGTSSTRSEQILVG